MTAEVPLESHLDGSIDMSLWQGRTDPEPHSERWHQKILPLSEGAAPGCVLLGFACDAGVARNQGRIGAAKGPAALRRALAPLAWHRHDPVYEAGDIVCHGDDDMEAAQARLAERVDALLGHEHLPIVLGGGHEMAFGSWLGLARHLAARDDSAPRVGIINFDAHFDLRDPSHVRSSGTPFAQVAEACKARGWPFRYACLGVSRAANTRALFNRAAELGVLVKEDREFQPTRLAAIQRDLERFVARCDHLYLTLDLDVLPAAEAPGVSAPAARGVPLSLIEPLIDSLRDSGKLRLADLAELNPDLDIDGRTARAAARLIHQLTLDCPPQETEMNSSQTPDPRHDASRRDAGRRNAGRKISAPTGSELSCKSWLSEAPLRMLMNNLHPDVAERPEELVVYGGIGRAARDWQCYDTIVETLQRLEDTQTLLVQSGKPVGVFETHKDAPRVLIANSNLVPAWANWEHFNELDKQGLMMYGQMTAGSWIYIGSQGIVQGTFETFVEAGRQHHDGNLKGRWILTAGLGGMGGAQPLAASLAGATSLTIECQQSRLDFRLRTRYQDEQAEDLDDALKRLERYTAEGKAISIGLCANAAEVLPELVRRGVRPDMVTDQTSAHDPLHGYLPQGWSWEAYVARGKAEPEATVKAAKRSMAVHVQAMLDFQAMGVPTFDYGNNIRQMALEEGVANAFDFPGFVPAYIRPLFCQGIGPFRWVALSGDPEDIVKTDRKVKELIPDDEHLHRWLDMARERISFQGLPARICWVGLKDRARLGQAFNEMVASGELKAPIVIGRDHLDSGSVASPNRETEAMMDGSDAVSDWPLLNALLNTAGGATWVSLHHGGGVGMGYSQHAGVVIVADGTDAAQMRLGRVLRNDPGTGVMRHADAGYELAKECARENGLDLPMLDSRA